MKYRFQVQLKCIKYIVYGYNCICKTCKTVSSDNGYKFNSCHYRPIYHADNNWQSGGKRQNTSIDSKDQNRAYIEKQAKPSYVNELRDTFCGRLCNPQTRTVSLRTEEVISQISYKLTAKIQKNETFIPYPSRNYNNMTAVASRNQ